MKEPPEEGTVVTIHDARYEYPAYGAVWSKVFGGIHIAGGAFFIACQAVLIEIESNTAYTGTGFWAGALLVVTGTFGILSGQYRSKRFIMAYMWLAISCIIVVTAGVVGNAVYGLLDDRATLYARSEREHKYEDARTSYYKWRDASEAVHIGSLIFMFFELLMLAGGSILGCKVLCKKAQHKQSYTYITAPVELIDSKPVVILPRKATTDVIYHTSSRGSSKPLSDDDEAALFYPSASCSSHQLSKDDEADLFYPSSHRVSQRQSQSLEPSEKQDSSHKQPQKEIMQQESFSPETEDHNVIEISKEPELAVDSKELPTVSETSSCSNESQDSKSSEITEETIAYQSSNVTPVGNHNLPSLSLSHDTGKGNRNSNDVSSDSSLTKVPSYSQSSVNSSQKAKGPIQLWRHDKTSPTHLSHSPSPHPGPRPPYPEFHGNARPPIPLWTQASQQARGPIPLWKQPPTNNAPHFQRRGPPDVAHRYQMPLSSGPPTRANPISYEKQSSPHGVSQVAYPEPSLSPNPYITQAGVPHRTDTPQQSSGFTPPEQHNIVISQSQSTSV